MVSLKAAAYFATTPALDVNTVDNNNLLPAFDYYYLLFGHLPRRKPFDE